MADTTTILNPGVGGDAMDESQVAQTSGANAKRPRVVLGNDLGQLTDAQAIVVLLEAIYRETRVHTVLLQKLLNTADGPIGFDEVFAIAAELHND